MLMMKTVFRAAQQCQPAVILIDECEKVIQLIKECRVAHWWHCMVDTATRSQVFVTDKRKSKLYGGAEPFNRIRKLLIQEVRRLFAPTVASHSMLYQALAA